jgi:hypothetical protein
MSVETLAAERSEISPAAARRLPNGIGILMCVFP